MELTKQTSVYSLRKKKKKHAISSFFFKNAYKKGLRDAFY